MRVIILTFVKLPGTIVFAVLVYRPLNPDRDCFELSLNGEISRLRSQLKMGR